MQLSKFVSCIKIDNNLYALYNRLIFEPIFLNENEKNNILDGKWHNLENRDINKLKKLGILVNNVKKTN